jgi:hypothetical protein
LRCHGQLHCEYTIINMNVGARMGWFESTYRMSSNDGWWTNYFRKQVCQQWKECCFGWASC